MKLPGHEILKTLARERELKLGEVAKLIRRKFNDHRDFHIVASLYSAGYVTSDLRKESDLDPTRNDDIALTFYTMTLGQGEFEYRGQKIINGGNFNEEVTIVCAAKTDLHFAELRAKRRERIWGLGVALIIAVTSAAATSYFRERFSASRGASNVTAKRVSRVGDPAKQKAAGSNTRPAQKP
jgi:hypothetical protein